MITDIIRVLQSDDFYNVGKSVEIAKGKHQYISSWKIGKQKILRQWRLRRK